MQQAPPSCRPGWTESLRPPAALASVRCRQQSCLQAEQQTQLRCFANPHLPQGVASAPPAEAGSEAPPRRPPPPPPPPNLPLPNAAASLAWQQMGGSPIFVFMLALYSNFGMGPFTSSSSPTWVGNWHNHQGHCRRICRVPRISRAASRPDDACFRGRYADGADHERPSGRPARNDGMQAPQCQRRRRRAHLHVCNVPAHHALGVPLDDQVEGACGHHRRSVTTGVRRVPQQPTKGPARCGCRGLCSLWQRCRAHPLGLDSPLWSRACTCDGH